MPEVPFNIEMILLAITLVMVAAVSFIEEISMLLKTKWLNQKKIIKAGKDYQLKNY